MAMSYHEEDYLAFGTEKIASDEVSVHEDNPTLDPVPTLQWWFVDSEQNTRGYAVGDCESMIDSCPDGGRSFILALTIDQSTLKEGSWVLNSSYVAYCLGVPCSPELPDEEGVDFVKRLALAQEGVRRPIVKFKALGDQNPDSPFHLNLTKQFDILAASLEVNRFHNLGGLDHGSPYFHNYAQAIDALEAASAALCTRSASIIQEKLMDAVQKELYKKEVRKSPKS